MDCLQKQCTWCTTFTETRTKMELGLLPIKVKYSYAKMQFIISLLVCSLRDLCRQLSRLCVRPTKII